MFLLATFQASADPLAAGIGAVARRRWSRSRSATRIYRGGVRLNLARFFRITGVVLVLVAAGLLMTARCTPRTRPAGSTSVRPRRSTCTWLVRPGTPCWPSLLTGVLGIQPEPDRRRGRRVGASYARARCSPFVLRPAGRRRARQAAATAVRRRPTTRRPDASPAQHRLTSTPHRPPAACRCRRLPATARAAALPRVAALAAVAARSPPARCRRRSVGGQAAAPEPARSRSTLTDDGCAPAPATVAGRAAHLRGHQHAAPTRSPRPR